MDSDGDDAPTVWNGASIPRHISHQQRVGWIVAAFATGLSFLAGIRSFWASMGFSLVGLVVAGGAWLHVQRPAGMACARVAGDCLPACLIQVDAQGIEIRRGVFWRTIISIPRSRVQHTDVSQGPLERTHELGTLVVYTAGTDHARVDLSGLAHARALRIREHLLPKGEADAI